MHWLISPYATDPSVTTELQPWLNAIHMATSASGLDDATNNSVNTVSDQKYCIFVLLLLLGERLSWARPVRHFSRNLPVQAGIWQKYLPHNLKFIFQKSQMPGGLPGGGGGGGALGIDSYIITSTKCLCGCLLSQTQKSKPMFAC